MPPIDHATCANVPLGALGVLAGLRGAADVQVQIIGGRAWLRWPANDGQVIRLLLPVPAVEFFVWHEGRWHRPGSRLPDFGVPDLNDPAPLYRVLSPEPVQPIPPASRVRRPVEAGLRRSDRPRRASALW